MQKIEPLIDYCEKPCINNVIQLSNPGKFTHLYWDDPRTSLFELL